jgi:hypothetical protein
MGTANVTSLKYSNGTLFSMSGNTLFPGASSTNLSGLGIHDMISTGNRHILVGDSGRILTRASTGSTPTSVPSAPSLVAPAQDEPAAPLYDLVKWTGSGGNSYNVQIALDSMFSNLVMENTHPAGTIRHSTGLLSTGTLYYWRVRGGNSLGYGPWSAVRRFTTASDPLTAPTLIFPAPGAAGVPLVDAFRWSKVVGVVTYQVQLAKTSDFSIFEYLRDSTITDTIRSFIGMFTTSGLDANSTYYWRVRARTAGQTGAYATGSFITGTSIHAAPEIGLQPASQTVVAGASAGFKVAAAVAGGGTLSYQWRRGTTTLLNGAGVAGATSDSLTLVNAAIADTGTNINVLVTSTLNGVTTPTTSGNAAVSVNVPPIITTQPVAIVTFVQGGTFTLSVAVAAGSGTSAGTLSYQWRKGNINLSNAAGQISGVTLASLTISNATIADSGTTAGGSAYNVAVTRTLNGTVTTTTSTKAQVVNTLAVPQGSFVFRVTGAEQPYTFRLPAGMSGVEEVTMSISDIWGRTIWIRSIFPVRDEKARELAWNGRTTNGRQASAGMYVVRIAVKNNGTTTDYVRKSVTLKPR